VGRLQSVSHLDNVRRCFSNKHREQKINSKVFKQIFLGELKPWAGIRRNMSLMATWPHMYRLPSDITLAFRASTCVHIGQDVTSVQKCAKWKKNNRISQSMQKHTRINQPVSVKNYAKMWQNTPD
jgi:hypothetical protein